MCLQIDGLRVNGTGDTDGKNPPRGEKMARDQEKKTWVSGRCGRLNCESLGRSEGSAWPLMTLHTHLHDAKSLWGLLLAFITFLFGQIRKYGIPTRLSRKLEPRSVRTTNGVHHSMIFNIVSVFWEFSLTISENTRRDHEFYLTKEEEKKINMFLSSF